MRSIHARARAAFVALMVLAFTLSATAIVAAATTYQLAGYEISPGFRVGANTYGTTFAGSVAGGGTWASSINYTGTPGLGGSATILGGSSSGYWVLKTAAGNRYGRVIGGSVVWPAVLSGPGSDIGCGEGVATFNAIVSKGLFNTTTRGGSIFGCLDDTHLATVFPPTVTATLTLD